MKLKYKSLLVVALMAAGGLSSCDTDFLDVTPPTEILVTRFGQMERWQRVS
jgi:hypothetical protein